MKKLFLVSAAALLVTWSPPVTAQQANFDRYRVLRMADMPRVEVHILPSTEPPTGIGEPGLPPVAPAVANALAVLTGERIRRLPLRTES